MEEKTIEQKMQKAISVLKEEYTSMRAGRANPAILDKITVDYYGIPTPIHQVSTVSVSEGRSLVIAPWSHDMLKEIEQAIHKAGIGIAPTNDGKVIRLPFPPLNEERRKELAREIARMAEAAKVSIRNVRHDGMEALEKQKKTGELPEDELKRAKDNVQKLTDRYISEVAKMQELKTEEIMEV